MAWDLLICVLVVVQILSSHDAYSLKHEQKRILLTDPDYADNLQMHKDIQTLKATVAQLQQHVTEQKQTNTQLSSTLGSLQSQLQQITSAPTGSVYTRWGKKTCSGNGTELVYSGLGAGGKSNEVGRSAVPVCMPHDPDNGQNSHAKHFGTLYGMEYNDPGLGQNLYDKDAPCAVCRVNYVSSVVTIPGKSTCYKGWNLEYSGILVAGQHTDAGASAYICLDQSPDVLEGGSEDMGGYTLFPVKAYCGSLRCPPYIQGSLVKCAVCSR